MESKIKRLLNKIQEDFPISSRPYLEIAHQLGMTEEEVLESIKELKKAGYIRRLGGVFDSRSLGYTSSLCAMKVEPSDVDKVGGRISSYIGVTHNYLRNHDYNMWFTITAPSEVHIQQIIHEIKSESGIDEIMVLEAVKTFKIKVNFDLMGAHNG